MEETMEKAILVAVNVNDKDYFIESLDELEELVKACDMTKVGTIIQNLDKVNNALYIGTGKVEEVKEKVIQTNADLVIFNNELSPSQLKNLQKILNVPILDRTALILEIFERRARTKEAKLQVEVAMLLSSCSKTIKQSLLPKKPAHKPFSLSHPLSSFLFLSLSLLIPSSLPPLLIWSGSR